MIAEKKYFTRLLKQNSMQLKFALHIHDVLYRDQSFTSLLADFCQDSNEGFAFIWYLNGTFH